MNVAEQAYSELTGRTSDKHLSIVYSGRFKEYNANVQYDVDKMIFSLSKQWRGVSDEIVIGLLQTLILKTMQKRSRKKYEKNTFYIDLYNNFIKNMSSYAATNNVDEILQLSFDRVNSRMFGGMMDMPNLVWGGYTKTQLGHYTYANNTVSISRVLEENEELLDFVVYHELLHKKHKFKHSGSRSISHTAAFRADEKKFSDKNMDEELRKFLRKRKTKKKKTLLQWFLR